jgi:N-acyl-L-homoserine lactone synthetase
MFEGLTLRAAAPNELREVLSFRSTIYREELGDSGIDRFDESAHHLIACDFAGQIVAALRIVGAEHRPFDLEQLFDLSAVLGAASNPAEVSRFCVAKERRQIHRSQLIHIGMLKLVHEFSIKNNISDLLTLGLPHLKNLYRLGFFSTVGSPCNHPIWGQTELMHLDLEAVRLRHKESSSSIARLLFRTNLPNIRV